MEAIRNEKEGAENYTASKQVAAIDALRTAVFNAFRAGISQWRCREVVKEVVVHYYQNDRNI